MNPEILKGADILLDTCGALKQGELAVIVCDDETLPLAKLLESRARTITHSVALIRIPGLNMHGEEPPSFAAQKMAEADLCLGVTKKSMAHTKARQNLTEKGGRYLSLPDYSLELLADPSLRADFRKRGELSQKIANQFTNGKRLTVTSPRGTNITMDIEGRSGNSCPGYVAHPGSIRSDWQSQIFAKVSGALSLAPLTTLMGSPPDIEANIAPKEFSAEGKVMVDGSIPFPGLGLLASPILLTIRKGSIAGIEGDPEVVQKLNRLFERARSPKATILAEVGVGLNDKAHLNGTMLVDEGTAGTVHFGFGSNATIGGVNDLPFHLDFVIQQPLLTVDDQKIYSQ